jgi:ABC-type amino acid transport substrate-binding protein
MRRSQRGFQLTGAGKALLVIVGVGVVAYALLKYRDRLPGHPTEPPPVATTVPQQPAATEQQPPAAAEEPPQSQATTESTPAGPFAPASSRASAGSGTVLARVRESGVLRVGMEPDAPPLHFINSRKQEDGFDFRLAGVLAEALGAGRVQVVEADYEDLPGKLTSGEVDVVMAGYVPDPSIAGVDWSIGYLDFGLCMIVHEGKAATLRSPADLAGKRIAIYDDPAAARWVKANVPNARIAKFSGDDGWFEAVENGQADALIYDYPFAAEEIKAHPRTVIVRYNLNQSRYAVAVAKNNYDLMYQINNAIDGFKSTPQYADLMREYLSSSSAAFMQPVAGRNTYTVKSGDTLSKIAAAKLGSADRWPEIWNLNRDRVANENLIYPKLVLLMP